MLGIPNVSPKTAWVGSLFSFHSLTWQALSDKPIKNLLGWHVAYVQPIEKQSLASSTSTVMISDSVQSPLTAG